jgi:hypothetical protein
VEDVEALPVTIGHLMMAEIEEEALPETVDYIHSRNGVDFIPSSMVLSAVDSKLRLEMGAEGMLSRILEEVLSCVVSVNSIDETKMLSYLAGYDSAFLYQKTGFIFSEYQTELGISNDFIKIRNNRSGNSKRYLTNGISEPGYSGEWKLVYPKNIKQMKNGGIEDAAI